LGPTFYVQSTTGTELTAKDAGSIVRRWSLGAHRFRGVITRTTLN